MHSGTELTTPSEHGRVYGWTSLGAEELALLPNGSESYLQAAAAAVEATKINCLSGCGNCALMATMFGEESAAKSIEIECPNTACPPSIGDSQVLAAHAKTIALLTTYGFEHTAVDDFSTPLASDLGLRQTEEGILETDFFGPDFVEPLIPEQMPPS